MTPPKSASAAEPPLAVATPAPAPNTLGARIQAFRTRYHTLETVAFFMGGFCFDLLLLERIDSRPMLIHQGSYLVLLSILLAVDHHYTVVGHGAPGFWSKVLHYRHELIHFLFGTLLNAFLVFYFKSSSGVYAFLFLVFLLALLIANEHPRFRDLGPLMRVGLLSFAFTSYFSYLFPVIAGFLSPWLFVAAVALASLATFVLWRLYSQFTHDPAWTFTRAVAPALGLQAALLLLYLLHVVPPVPLSIKWMGIYHDVKFDGAEAKLTREKPTWRFWEHGDVRFHARAGDRVYVYVRIFAPRNFRDGLSIRWSHENAATHKEESEAVPLTIVGGREEGFRALAFKAHYAPGEWEVGIETRDGREIGHLGFEIEEDASSGARELVEEVR